MELTWKEHGGMSGVHTYQGVLVWWHTPGGPNGRFGETACTQSFEDFRENGPAVTAPPEIIEQLRAVYGSRSGNDRSVRLA